MARVLWTPSAEADLAEIHLYIATRAQSAAPADRWIDVIRDKCRLYAGQPEMGEARPDLGADLRVLIVGEYVVIYHPVQAGIEVLRVVHGRRDYPALFPESNPPQP